MARQKIKIVRTLPGAHSLRSIVASFCAKAGVVTSFSDQRLPVALDLVPGDDQVEVLAFGEVVGRFLLMCGQRMQPLARKGHVEAAIGLACEELPEESLFRPSARFPGTHRRIQATLEELRSWGIDGAELSALASRASPHLARKIADLAFVEAHVQDTLGRLGLCTNDQRIRECIECDVQDSPRFDRLLVLAGSDYDPNRIQWIKWAASRGANITVVVDASATPNEGLFSGAARIVSEFGLAPEIQGEPNPLARHLFTGDQGANDNFAVTISSCADMLAEAEWALRGCLEDAEQGMPLQAMALYVRHLESYAPLIQFAAERLQVPIRMARRAPLLTNAFARLILCALDFCASSDVRSLLSILKSSYLALSVEDQAAISGAIKHAYSKRSAQWNELEEWAAGKAEEHGWLAALLKWRTEVRHDRATLAGWIDRLRTMMDSVEWNQASAQGPAATKERDMRAQNALQRALAQQASVIRVRENPPLDLKEFAVKCRAILEESDTSVPVGEIGVPVVSSSDQLGPVQSLRILGMLEGVFPRRRREDPVLADDERKEIGRLRPGAPSLLDSYDAARAERDEFYRVCAAPTKSIVLSYPQTDEERDNVPAFYLKEVEAAVIRVHTVDHPRSELVPPVPVSKADISLKEGFDAVREAPLMNKLVTEGAAASVRSPEEGPFTPSELRNVLECPFRWMAGSPLGLRLNRERSRWSRLRQIPQSVQLARIASPDEARKAMLDALGAELEKLYSEASEYDLALLEAGGRRVIEEWIEREFHARLLWPKDEGSVRTLQSFGDGFVKGSLPLFGKNIAIHGEIGATATMGQYSVALMTEHRRPKEEPETKEISDLDKLELGLHLLAIYGHRNGSAIESEALHTERTLYVLPRIAGQPLESRRQEGLRVVDLGEPRDFFDTVKTKMKEALRRVTMPEVEAIPDEHCRWCDYGELCRRHIDFSEERSPFDKDGDWQDV